RIRRPSFCLCLPCGIRHDVSGCHDWRRGISWRLEHTAAEYRVGTACRLDDRMGMGRFLDAFQNAAHCRHPDVDPLDTPPAPGRSVDVTVLESTYATGVPMHGYFRNLAGVGNGVTKLGSKRTGE